MTRELFIPGPVTIPLDRALEDRRRAEELLEAGTVGILVEPLLAIAGGILGGAAVTALAWRIEWAHSTRRATRAGARRLRRNLAGRP